VGFFVRGLETAILQHEIDLAVHSLKDMPSRMPPNLALGSIPERGDPRDTLISETGASLMDLPAGARVGTSSPRRKAQILARRPDLTIAGIRGNVDTRLRKLEGSGYDALVLAAAGLIRLGRERAIDQVLPPEVLLPAAGQGALAVEIRADDDRIRPLVTPVNHFPSWAAALAERAFMARLGAGCHVPAAAYAVVDDGELWLRGLVASPKGRTIMHSARRGPLNAAEALGTCVAEDLLRQGARDLLKRETLATKRQT
jgi:hydroxymethylbilane synthase